MKALIKIIGFGLLCAQSSLVLAQIDLSGHWRKTGHEEHFSEVGIGNYNALPINEAARVRADSWNPERLFMPEHQCEPHPSPYAPVGPANTRITPIVDPDTQVTIGWHFVLHWMENARTVWMDGREHPPAWAAHTWAGFSTGEWQGDMLTVTTTHLREGWIRRNGLPQSDQAVMREHWTLNDDVLTLVSVLNDPVFLTEPLIRTITWRRDPGYQVGTYNCHATAEIEHPYGFVPFFLPGTNPMLNDNVISEMGLPQDVVRGGAHTMLPEYMERLQSFPGIPGPIDSGQ